MTTTMGNGPASTDTPNAATFSNVTLTGDLTAKTGRSASWTIAPSTADANLRTQADETVDDNELAPAIAASLALGRDDILLTRGIFEENATIVPVQGLDLHGKGMLNTVIRSTSTANHIIAADSVNHFNLSNLKLAYNLADWTALAAWHIYGDDVNFWTIDHVAIVLDGGGTAKGTTNTYGGICLKKSAATAWQNSLENLYIAYGYIKFDGSTDNYMADCKINAQYHSYAFQESVSGGNRILGNHFIGGNTYTVELNGAGDTFSVNQIDHSLSTGLHVVGGGLHTITANHIYNTAVHGVFFNNTTFNTFKANVVRESAYITAGGREILLANASAHNILQGNIIRNTAVSGMVYSGIEELAAADDYNNVSDNQVLIDNYAAGGSAVIKNGINSNHHDNIVA